MSAAGFIDHLIFDHMIWDAPASHPFDSGEPAPTGSPSHDDGLDTLIAGPASAGVDALAAVPFSTPAGDSIPPTEPAGSNTLHHDPRAGVVDLTASTTAPEGPCPLVAPSLSAEPTDVAGPSTGRESNSDQGEPGHVAHGVPTTSTGCRCSHSATWHRSWTYCEAPGCACDRFRRRP